MLGRDRQGPCRSLQADIKLRNNGIWVPRLDSSSSKRSLDIILCKGLVVGCLECNEELRLGDVVDGSPDKEVDLVAICALQWQI